MNEATLVGQLERALQREMPGCCVLKHNDGSTAGIPDLSVTWRGQTAWLEVKYDRPTARAKVSELQKLTLRRLDGWLVWYAVSSKGVRSTQLGRASGLELDVSGAFAHADVALTIRKSLEGR